MAPTDEQPPGGGQAWFSTTHWSVVLKAHSPDEVESQDALATLCQAYWSPVFAYIRSRGHDAETARDLTQSFFAAILERQGIAKARQEKGRFRSFLLGSVKNFLANEQDYQRTLKRGGGQVPISIDAQSWESALSGHEPATHLTPERLFEKRWVLALLDRAMRDLEEDMERSGNLERFRKFRVYLVNDADPPYERLRQELGMEESAIRVALHRMRQRFGAKLREQVAQTVEDRRATEDELRYLIGVMCG